jgi:hypothetical protein
MKDATDRQTSPYSSLTLKHKEQPISMENFEKKNGHKAYLNTENSIQNQVSAPSMSVIS